MNDGDNPKRKRQDSIENQPRKIPRKMLDALKNPPPQITSLQSANSPLQSANSAMQTTEIDSSQVKVLIFLSNLHDKELFDCFYGSDIEVNFKELTKKQRNAIAGKVGDRFVKSIQEKSHNHICIGLSETYPVDSIQDDDNNFIILLVVEKQIQGIVIGTVTENYKKETPFLYIDVICTNPVKYIYLGNFLINYLKTVVTLKLHNNLSLGKNIRNTRSHYTIMLNSVDSLKTIQWYVKMGFRNPDDEPTTDTLINMVWRVNYDDVDIPKHNTLYKPPRILKLDPSHHEEASKKAYEKKTYNPATDRHMISTTPRKFVETPQPTPTQSPTIHMDATDVLNPSSSFDFDDLTTFYDIANDEKTSSTSNNAAATHKDENGVYKMNSASSFDFDAHKDEDEDWERVSLGSFGSDVVPGLDYSYDDMTQDDMTQDDMTQGDVALGKNKRKSIRKGKRKSIRKGKRSKINTKRRKPKKIDFKIHNK